MDADRTMHTLPPIDDWWPGLPEHLQSRVLAKLDEPLDPLVIDEVLRARGLEDSTLDGYNVVRLTAAEREFVRNYPE
ncbi:MAG: hypothetical protein EPN91_06315 [Salinibacterium sp.]|nr:MAG: hypothetical protein EPN91_06315 [Salinibacterium sp.]